MNASLLLEMKVSNFFLSVKFLVVLKEINSLFADKRCCIHETTPRRNIQYHVMRSDFHGCNGSSDVS